MAGRRLSIRNIKEVLRLRWIAGSSAREIPMIAARWAGALPLPGFFVMLLVVAIYLIGGSIMDDLAFMVLATPIFFPTAVQLGYDPIWFGILICVTLMIGGLIPPVAIYVFILGNITGIPFLSALVVALTFLFVFPQIALWLPNLMMGKG